MTMIIAKLKMAIAIWARNDPYPKHGDMPYYLSIFGISVSCILHTTPHTWWPLAGVTVAVAPFHGMQLLLKSSL